MTINYITFDSWWDTDVTVLPELCKKHKVRVFNTQGKQNNKYEEKSVPENATIYTETFPYRGRDLRNIPYVIRVLRRILAASRDKQSVNVFLGNGNPIFMFLSLLLLPPARTIISKHDYKSHGDMKGMGNMLGRIEELYYRRFCFFHFHSESQKQLFCADYPDKKAFSTEMPLKDIGDPKRPLPDDDRVRLLFFGQVRGYKRPEMLIKAASAVGGKRLLVTFAGKIYAPNNNNAAYEKELTDMMRDKEMFDLHFDFIANADIADYFSSSDFLVLPYDSATQSGPSLVAVNYGLPIICTDTIPFRRLVKDGQNGFMFKVGDEKGLEKVLAKVARMSRAQIDDMKNCQREFREQYKAATVIGKEYDSFIKEQMKISDNENNI